MKTTKTAKTTVATMPADALIAIWHLYEFYPHFRIVDATTLECTVRSTMLAQVMIGASKNLEGAGFRIRPYATGFSLVA